jgi:hypothetical protein
MFPDLAYGQSDINAVLLEEIQVLFQRAADGLHAPVDPSIQELGLLQEARARSLRKLLDLHLAIAIEASPRMADALTSDNPRQRQIG